MQWQTGSEHPDVSNLTDDVLGGKQELARTCSSAYDTVGGQSTGNTGLAVGHSS